MSTITGFDEKTNGWNKAIVQKMGGVDIADAFLRGEYILTKVAEAVVTFLEHIGKVAVEVTDQIDLETFFESKEGLWVNNDFKKLFVTAGAKFLPKSFLLSKYTVKKNALDTKIRKELPENHVFEADDFAPVLATLIKKQWGGKQGELITTGFSNIFYVRSKDKKQVFAVNVYWDSGAQDWRVDFWELGGRRWRAEHVIFSCN